MKTFADLKRRIVSGSVLEMTFHKHSADGNGLVGSKRTVEIVQSNAIALRTDLPRTGKPGVSWLYWPKAKEISIDGPDEFSVLQEDGSVLMSYRIIA